MAEKQTHILLLEDDEEDASLVELALRQVGAEWFHLVHVKTIPEAKQKISEGSFNIMFADLFLPGSKGLDTLKSFNTQDLQFPVIVLTGLDDETIGSEALQAGAQDYLIKGKIDGGLLVRAIRYAIQRKRLEDERRNLQEQLLRSQKMEAIGTLAGGIAHDFNNILTVISGFSEMIMNHLGRNSPHWERLNEIVKAARRATDLTQQLLAFGRKQVLAPTRLDLNNVVRDLETIFRRLLGENIELTTFLNPSLGWVKADKSQIEQAIVNLALNARDAMPQGGRLTIETDIGIVDEGCPKQKVGLNGGTYVTLAVSDTGCGMDPATQARIFEPFFTTKKERGTGLGLATVYGTIKQSGGEIFVESEVGRGTTFKIFFPQVTPEIKEVEPSRKGSNDEVEHFGGHETILLVEDEVPVRKLAKEILCLKGYSVIEAEDPEDALSLLEQQRGPIHLLLTDIMMPKMNGCKLAECFTVLHPEAKILYMTGYSESLLAKQGVSQINSTLVRKPFMIDELVTKVRDLLDSSASPPVSG